MRQIKRCFKQENDGIKRLLDYLVIVGDDKISCEALSCQHPCQLIELRTIRPLTASSTDCTRAVPTNNSTVYVSKSLLAMSYLFGFYRVC